MNLILFQSIKDNLIHCFNIQLIEAMDWCTVSIDLLDNQLIDQLHETNIVKLFQKCSLLDLFSFSFFFWLDILIS